MQLSLAEEPKLHAQNRMGLISGTFSTFVHTSLVVWQPPGFTVFVILSMYGWSDPAWQWSIHQCRGLRRQHSSTCQVLWGNRQALGDGVFGTAAGQGSCPHKAQQPSESLFLHQPGPFFTDDACTWILKKKNFCIYMLLQSLSLLPPPTSLLLRLTLLCVH